MTHEPTPSRSGPLRLTKTLSIPGRRCWKETLWAHRRKSSTRRGESRWHVMSTCIVVDPASPANGGGGARYGAVSTYVDVSSPMRTSYWSVSGWYFHTRASSPFSFCPASELKFLHCLCCRTGLQGPSLTTGIILHKTKI